MDNKEFKMHIKDIVNESLLADAAGRHKEKYLAAVERMSSFDSATEIYNVDFKEIKYYIDHGIEKAYETMVREPHFWGKGMDVPSWSHDLKSIYNAHDVISGFKKFEKISGSRNHPILDSEKAFYKEAQPIAQKLKALKAKIVKGRKPNPNAKKKDVYSTPASAKNDVEKVRNELTKITDNVYNKLVATNYSSMERKVALFKEAQNKDPALAVYNFFAHDPYSRQIVSKAYRSDSGIKRPGDPEILRKDWKEVIKKEAEEEATNVRDQFINKNTAKLSSIVGNKGDLTEVTSIEARSSRGVIEGEMHLAFKDGAQFNVRNKVVSVVNAHGTFFYRFPTTFHDIVKSDGAKFKRMSEKQMNEEF